MRNEGYAIDYWPKIQNLGKLERGEYDIIILDIGGVAQEYTHENGLGILEHLKDVNPAQIVVAFSGQTFDLSKNRFWQMADDSLSKPVDATKCKRILDNLIENKMTLSHYWGAVVKILRREQVSDKNIAQLEDKLTRALQSKNEVDFSEILKSICAKADLVLKLSAIGAKMLALLG